MPFIGSSNIPNKLVVGSYSYITGPTGNSGPKGSTGIGITGPTGANGIQFVTTSVVGYTLTIKYEDSTEFDLSVTAASGSMQAISFPNFTVSFTGSSSTDAFSLFGGYTGLNPYKLLFKSIRVLGEATAGISLDSIYIASATASNINIGKTGSLLFIKDNKIVPTNDFNTNYIENIMAPISGSLFGITLHTFTFKESQDLTSQFKVDQKTNLNWLFTSNINDTLNNIDITYSQLQSSLNIFNRTDQGLFIFAVDEETNSITPKISFRAEGITLQSSGSTITGPVQISITGKGLTYSEQTYTSHIIGSCCYCSNETSNNFETTCLDYSSKPFCDSINGKFNFKSCNERYLSGDCYSGGSCCVNGVCLETNKELCQKVYGVFYPNVKCNTLDFGCPDSCPTTTSCCVNGICYSLPSGDASVDLCNELHGSYSEESCDVRNCCVEGFLGACCFGTDCKDNYTPAQCSLENGVYQGPGSFCSSSECCKSVDENTAYIRAISQIPSDIKVGDYFEGGIVAGFIGYPPPTGFPLEDIFAKGEVISEVENYMSTSIKRYVGVNGVFDETLKCNCANFSPSRYISTNDLGLNTGKALKQNVKHLSGVNDDISLTFYNRLSDVCLNNDGKPCNEKNIEYKNYGFNSIQAYKNQALAIYGNQIPNAWILIVAPEDFAIGNVSFGMSMSVNGFAIPDNMKNYENQLWQNNTLTPYGTTVFDGLVNTRLFDDTSIDRNTWYISSNYTIKGNLQTFDPLAYYRFKHPKYSYWQTDIDVDLLSKNSEYFKTHYAKMWNTINTSTTALYNISVKNKLSYNGYSDWYIPSALEMNVIYNNLEKINNSIIYNAKSSWRTISEEKYWTSTTGGKLINSKSYSSGAPNAKFYEAYDYNLEGIVTTGDYLLDSWKSYKLALAHRTYTQDMSNGRMISELKSSKTAKLRACRMVPIYFKNENLQNQFEYSFKQFNACSSCR